tara:strand:- start:185 stop:355 length:171 start_codon:yes stop_codon:yes gene_type:complete
MSVKWISESTESCREERRKGCLEKKEEKVESERELGDIKNMRAIESYRLKVRFLEP